MCLTITVNAWDTSSHWLYKSPLFCSHAGAFRLASSAGEKKSVEDILGCDLIDFTGTQESIFSKPSAQTSHRVWYTTTSNGGACIRRPNDTPLCFVLGPSGSGKTTFARMHVAWKLYQNDEPPRLKRVTLYLYPETANVKFIYKDEASGTEIVNKCAAEELFNWLRREIGRKADTEFQHKLKMHVCIIIDNVGAPEDFKSWLLDKGGAHWLTTEANGFAESVVVAVCSTEGSPDKWEVYDWINIFRMTPWTDKDLEQVLSSSREKLKLAFVGGVETVETLAKTLWAHPKLRALATNARTACSMVDALANVRSMCYRDPWSAQLDELAALVVPRVLDDYMFRYSISELTQRQQRRIAASVFHVLNQREQAEGEAPTFLGLTGNEIKLAESFLNYKKIPYRATSRLAVTPAHELVLFAMAGIPTSLMGQWKTEEQLAAFYVVRQAMIQCMDRFDTDVAEDRCKRRGRGTDADTDPGSSLEQLDKSLDSVRLYRLERQVNYNHEATYWYVPMVDVGPRTMDGQGAQFADIIAPYTIIQAWRTPSNLPLKVDLRKELRKCGLMKDGCDTRVLQGLHALWQLHTNVRGGEMTVLNETRTSTENLASVAAPTNPVQYTVMKDGPGIEVKITLGNGADVGLPSLDGTTVSFILSTDADTVTVDCGKYGPFGPWGPYVTITKANLDEDREVDVSTLSDREKSHWREFFSDKIRDECKIKFLFTTVTSE